MAQIDANGDQAKRKVVLPGDIIAALDQLDDFERQQVREVLEVLAHGRPPSVTMRHLTGLADELDLYVVRAAPKVLLIVRLPEDAPIEVVELVRPATLKMFATPQPAIASA